MDGANGLYGYLLAHLGTFEATLPTSPSVYSPILMLVSPVSASLTTATLLSPHLHPQAASTLSPALRVSNGHIRAALLVLAAKNYLGLLADMKDLVEAAYSSAPDADVIRSVRR